MKNRIILPLDNKSVEESKAIINETKDIVWGYKIRRQILDVGLGFLDEHENMMVDFKLYDIPSAMEEAANTFIDAGAKIVTAHCSAEWKPDSLVTASYLAGVTVLTSFRNAPGYFCFTQVAAAVQYFNETVINPFHYGFIVCSAQDLTDIKTEAMCITPGIRPLWYQENDDQERTMTPGEAVNVGSDLLVIGRPILNSENIADAVRKTNDEIWGAEQNDF